MLVSVAALNPSRRFRSSLLSLSRLVPERYTKHAVQLPFNLNNGFKRDLSTYVTPSSQIEYDNRIKSSRAPTQLNRELEIQPSIFEGLGNTTAASEVSSPQLKITIVDTFERAHAVLKILYDQHARNPGTVWACDTEVADIDLSLVGEKRELIMTLHDPSYQLVLNLCFRA